MKSLVLEDSETGEETEYEGAVDVLSVSGTVRWADRDGKSHSKSACRIQAAGGKINVGVDVDGEKTVYRDIRTIGYSEKEGQFYIAGPGRVDAVAGEVVRVRDIILPS